MRSEVEWVEKNVLEIEWFINLVNNKLDEVIINLGDVWKFVEEFIVLVEEVGEIVDKVKVVSWIGWDVIMLLEI